MPEYENQTISKLRYATISANRNQKDKIDLLRSFFIFLSKSEVMQKVVMKWKIARKVSFRFVAGEKNSEAVEVVKQLNDEGFFATIDHLGEHTSTKELAKKSTDEIIELIQTIYKNNLIAGISIKLTQIGLLLGDQILKENLREILSYGKSLNIFIRIDMEDSSITENTIEILHWARSIYPGVGIVIQSYLYRSLEDIRSLMTECIPIRMVKGAYNEPDNVAFSQKKDVDHNFDVLCELVIDQAFSCPDTSLSDHGKIPPILAIGSHDEKRIKNAIDYAEDCGFPKDQIEIQMLFGIRRDLQSKYRDLGYAVRVYVPYGSHWYPYFMRRLAERPANFFFFLTNLFKR